MAFVTTAEADDLRALDGVTPDIESELDGKLNKSGKNLIIRACDRFLGEQGIGGL